MLLYCDLQLLVVLSVLLLRILRVRRIGLLLPHRMPALRVLLRPVVTAILTALHSVSSVLYLTVAVLVVLQFGLQNSIRVFGLVIDGSLWFLILLGFLLRLPLRTVPRMHCIHRFSLLLIVIGLLHGLLFLRPHGRSVVPSEGERAGASRSVVHSCAESIRVGKVVSVVVSH